MRPLKILIVDDEFDFCRLVVMMLSQERYLIECARNLNEASFMMHANHPQIVLLDNNLPDGSGIQFLKANKDLFEGSHTIVISADPSPEIRRIVSESGAQYLAKPFGMKKLKEMIKKAA